MKENSSRSRYRIQPETNVRILFGRMIHELKDSFNMLNGWGWTPNSDPDFEKLQEKRNADYLNALHEQEREILSKFLNERKALVAKYASPGGAWYLFTIVEGIDLINRQGLDSDSERKELEFFTRHFFEKWDADGKRTFTPDEVNEIKIRESYIRKELRISLEPLEYSRENEYQYYVDTRRKTQVNTGIRIPPGLLTVKLNTLQSRSLFIAFKELSINLQELTVNSYKVQKLTISSTLFLKDYPNLTDHLTYLQTTHTMREDGRIDWQGSMNNLAFVARHHWHKNGQASCNEIFSKAMYYFTFKSNEIIKDSFCSAFYKDEVKNKNPDSFGLKEHP